MEEMDSELFPRYGEQKNAQIETNYKKSEREMIKGRKSMKTNREFILREIAGEVVLIPTGEASQNLNGMIHLTETGAFIWKQVDTAADLEEISERIRSEFEVDEETARRDVRGFLYELYIRDLVTDIPEFEQDNKD